MSKLELKAAMESLQVKKPLKLYDRQPQFKVPAPIADATSVAGETQVAEATEVPAQTTVPVATQVAAPTQVATRTPVDMETPVPVPTQVAVPTMVPAPTQVGAQTLVPAPTQVIPEEEVTRSASDQDSSVTLEAQAAPKLQQGYTRLPNSFLMRMAAGDLVRSEMQILLLIARFTISFQKRYAPLSKTVLERQSGLRGPAILQAISDLQTKGLIVKIPGDQHRPNQLGLVFDDEWEFFSKTKAPTTSVPAQTQVAQATPVPLATPVAVGTPAPVAVPTPAEVAAATPFKDIQRYQNNSLSQLPESLRKYFASVKPRSKREAELRAFEGVRSDYDGSVIGDCLVHVLERGVLLTGSPCHSPMAYLSKAIAQVAAEVAAIKEASQKARDCARRLAEDQVKLRGQADREEAEIAERNRDFQTAFPTPDAQAKEIGRHSTQFPMLDPNGPIIRNLAIGAWWDEKRAQKQGNWPS